MLYEQYEKKVLAIAKFRAKLYKYRLLLALIATLLCTSLVSFLFCKGILISDITGANNVVYGEEYDFDAKVFLGEAAYEYSYDNGESWINIKPVDAGTYRVRAIETRIFGLKSRGRERDFVIKQKQITLTLNDYTAEYNGEEHYIDSYEITDGGLVKNGTIDDRIESITTSVKETLVCKKTNKIESVKVVDKDGNDVTDNYKVTFVDAKFEITKKSITVESSEATQEYNGTALTCNEYNEEEVLSSLATGDSIKDVEFTASLTDFVDGGIDNEFTITIANSKGEDVTNCYEITYVFGKLTIEKRTVKITADNYWGYYNGEEHTFSDYSVDGLLKGHEIRTLKMTESSRITLVGEQKNVIDKQSITIFSGEIDVTNNYNIECLEGTLTVKKLALTVESLSKSKTYNGEALTCEEYEVSRSLIGGDEIQVDFTGSITYFGDGENGELPNTFEVKIMRGETDVTHCYDITQNFGTLKINKKEITVESEGESHVYDGNAFKYEKYNEADVLSSLATGDSIKDVEFTASLTDFADGGIDNEFTITIANSKGEDVTNCYEITYVFGKLTIEKRDIKVKAGDREETYNGMPLTYNQIYTYDETGLAEGHYFANVVMSESSTKTTVGEQDNEIATYEIRDAQNKIVTENYNEIGREKGILKVIKREIIVQAESKTQVYNGTLLTCENILLVEGTLAKDHNFANVQMTAESTITTVGTQDNEISSFDIIDKNNNSVKDNYDVIETRKGTLTITKREIIVQAESRSKVYDGDSLSCNLIIDSTAGQENKGLVIGHTFDEIQMASTSIITSAGTKINSINSYKIIDENGNDVTSNYKEVERKNGTLKIIEREIIVQAETRSKVYDGDSLSCNLIIDATAGQENKGLLAGHTFDEIQMASTSIITNVGTKINSINSYKIIDENGNDVTSNYNEIERKTGTLEITKRKISITVDVGAGTKVYDGTNEFEGGLSYSTESLYEFIGSQTITFNTYLTSANAGKCECEIDANSVKYINGAKKENYEIEFKNAPFEILKREIIIVPSYAEKVYDGTELTTNRCEAKAGGTQLVAGHYIICPTVAKIIDFGNVENEVVSNYKEIAVIYNANNEIVTENYNIIGAGQNIEGENGCSLADKNVSVLSVKLSELKFRSKDRQFVYDGDKHYYKEFELVSGTIVDGHTAEAEWFEGSFVIEYNKDYSKNNGFDIKIKNKDDSYNTNYLITCEYGTLSIIKRSISFKAVDKEKIYDGTPLTSSEVVEYLPLGESTRLVKNHTYKNAITKGSRTDAGKGENEITEIQIYNPDNDKNVTKNYSIKFISGNLTVIQREITITADAEKVYDGTTDTSLHIKVGSITVVNGSLVADHEIANIVSNANVATIDASENIIKYCTIICGKKDFTDNYKITFVKGVVVIIKRQINITVVNQEKVYDGEEFVSNKVIDSSNTTSNPNSGLVGGDVFVDPETDGKIVNAGVIVNNLVGIEIYDANGNKVTLNYDITSISGELTVFRRQITVTAGSAKKEYDGTPLTNGGYTIDGAIYGHDFTNYITTEGSITNWNENAKDNNKIVINDSVVFIKDAQGNLIPTSNYEIISQSGTLEITKREITIVAGDQEKVYDGTPLVWGDYTYSHNGGSEIVLPNGQQITLEMTEDSTRTEIGKTYNTIDEESIKIYLGTEVITFNYEINITVGILTILPRPISITVVDKEKIYDGTPLTSNECVISENTSYPLVDGHYLDCLTAGSITNYITGGVINELRNTRIYDANGNNVSKNYQIESVQNGILTIIKRAITLTANAEKVYDGKTSVEAYGIIHSSSENALIDGHIYKVKGNAFNADVDQDKILMLSTGTCTITDYWGYSVTNNYDVTLENGIVTITPREIEIAIPNYTKVYDGQVQELAVLSNNDISANSPYTLANNHSLTAKLEYKDNTDLAECGVKELDLKSIVIHDLNSSNVRDVTDNYQVTYTLGSVTITPRTLTITAASKTKEYDGTPLTNSNYSMSGLVTKHTITGIKITGSIKDVGYVNNVIDITNVKVKDSFGNDKTHNYEIKGVNGVLTITKRKVEITFFEARKVYDGTALTLPTLTEFWISSTKKLISGHEISFSNMTLTDEDGNILSASEISNLVNAGMYILSATPTVKDKSTNQDVTHNYDVTINSNIQIEKRLIIFTALDKADDELVLFSDLKVMVGSLIEGHGFTVIDESIMMLPSEWMAYIAVKDITPGDDETIFYTDNYEFVYRSKTSQ